METTMTGVQRRKKILEMLGQSSTPLSGGALGRAVGVSRQVEGQDIALLRTEGHPVLATARGYVLEVPHQTERLFKMCHTTEQTREELNTIVDLGGEVLDVMVNHRIYGKVSAPLNIRSRRDVEAFVENIRTGRSTPLLNVTSGYHFHHVAADQEEILDEIEAALREKGFAAVGYPVEIHSLCLVVNIENSNAFDAMKETFVALANEIYKQLDVQLKVSLSSGCRKLDMVHDAYLEAHAVQQYHLFYGAKQVAFYTSENLVSGPGALFDAETRHTLMMLLRKRDERAIRKFIDDQLDSIQQRKTGPDAIYLCAAEMMSAIFEYISARFGDTGEGIAPENSYSSLLSLNHVDAIRKFVQDRAWDAMNQSNNDENAHGALIRRVHEYIDGNFSNSAMRLDDVARANFISTQYLCSVYRRATRFTIGDYIFEVRMRHAMKLINEGQRNVTSISESCGYDDPGYFCKCFRKKYGMTPRQYIESQNT